MPLHRTILLGTATLALAGCNPFHRSPPVEVSAEDVNLNTRWYGTLTPPSM